MILFRIIYIWKDKHIMKKFSFIHCGDLHLGCQQFNEPERFFDFMNSFNYIVEYAAAKKVNYFLIAGDLFHHRNINASTLGLTMDILRKLKEAGIETIAIEGNHDKAFYVDEESWMSFLNRQGYFKLLKPYYENGKLKLLPYDGNKGNYIKRDGLIITGLGYLGATTWQRLEEVFPEFDTHEDFSVLLLHAAVDKLIGMDMAGVRKESLEKFHDRVDYIALGHIHSRQETDGFIYNPGAPESVHIDEVRKNQEKGFYHVIVENGEKNVEFIPSTRRKICYFNINLSAIKKPDEAVLKVIHELSEFDFEEYDRPLVQVNLFGNIPFNSFAIDINDIVEKVRSSCSCLAVEVLNNTNISQDSTLGDITSFDRKSVERSVISQMIGESRPDLLCMEEELVNLILNIRDWSLSGVDDKEIVNEIERLIDMVSLAEAAASKEEETNEN